LGNWFWGVQHELLRIRQTQTSLHIYVKRVSIFGFKLKTDI